MERLSQVRQSLPIQNQYFEEIMQEKIKCGKFQYISVLTLGMLWVADAAEMQVLGFILPVIQNEWNLEDWQTNLIGSSVFFFWGFSAVCSGQFSDLYGRRLPLLICTAGSAIFAVVSAFAQDCWQFLVLRCIFGFFLGVGNPLTATYISEIVPKEQRAKYFGIVYNTFPFGEIATIGIAYLCLDNLQSGAWRFLLLWTSIPNVIAFFLAVFYLKESPRFLLISQNIENSKQQGYELLDHMGKLNNKESYEELTSTQKQKLSIWGNEQSEAQQQYQGSVLQLFSKEFYSISIKTMTMWFSLAFVYYGVVYQLPTILFKIHQGKGNAIEDKNENDFIGIFFSSFVGIPSNLLGFFMLEKKEIGRKLTLCVSYVICVVGCFITYIHANDDGIFFFFVGCVKFFINVSYLACFMFTSEIYPTTLRSTGLGFNNAVTRFGGVLMPWVALIFYVFGNTGPFLSCGIVSVFSAIAAFKIPSDTKNIILDTYIQLTDKPKKKSSIQNEM